MFNCNLCQPERIFSSDIAFEVHKETHHKSEQKVTENLQNSENNNIYKEAIDSVEELGKTISLLEVNKMDFFKKKESEQELNIQPNIVRSFIYELTLEITEQKDKKVMEVNSRINSVIMNLVNDGFDVTIKHQKTEKQF